MNLSNIESSNYQPSYHNVTRIPISIYNDESEIFSVNPADFAPTYGSAPQEDFVSSISLLRRDIDCLCPYLRKWGGFVCGGFARYSVSPFNSEVVPADVDVYFSTPRGFILACEETVNSLGYKERYNNDISVGFELTEIKHDKRFAILPKMLNFVKPFRDSSLVTCGKPMEIMSFFDFTVCCVAIFVLGAQPLAIVHKNFFADDENRILRINHVLCPFGSLNRVVRYEKKGYKLPMSESLKIFQRWDALTKREKDEIYRFLLKENNNG